MTRRQRRRTVCLLHVAARRAELVRRAVFLGHMITLSPESNDPSRDADVARVLDAMEDVMLAVLHILHALQDETDPTTVAMAVGTACELLRGLTVLMRAVGGAGEGC
jgi:hypothetical protein